MEESVLYWRVNSCFFFSSMENNDDFICKVKWKLTVIKELEELNATCRQNNQHSQNNIELCIQHMKTYHQQSISDTKFHHNCALQAINQHLNGPFVVVSSSMNTLSIDDSWFSFAAGGTHSKYAGMHSGGGGTKPPFVVEIYLLDMTPRPCLLRGVLATSWPGPCLERPGQTGLPHRVALHHGQVQGIREYIESERHRNSS